MTSSHPAEETLRALRAVTAVVDDPELVAAAALDGRGRRQGRALALVRPASTEEVSAVVRLARERNLILIAQGGNTSNVEGATPAPGASPDEASRTVIVQLSRMNRILSIDPVNNTAVVEAGVILKNLQEAADRAGRLFPLSLAAEGTAQVGGVLASNAGGIHVLRFGMARNLCLGLRAVLADGSVLDLMRDLRKDNSGYDLRDLFIGSEGTLSIITEAVLTLHPRPLGRKTAWAALSGLDSVERLFTALESTLGPRLTAFELIARAPLEAALSEGGRAPMELSDWQVLCDANYFSDPEEAILEEALEEALGACIEEGTLSNAVLAQSESDASDFWALREGIPGAVKRSGGNVKHDISVPRSVLPRFVASTVTELRAAFPWCEPSVFGHYGDGNLHFNVGSPERSRLAFAHEAAIHRLVHDAVVRFGGSIAAEHGVGAMKVGELERTKSPEELSLMRVLKRALDPENRLNPGRVVRLL